MPSSNEPDDQAARPCAGPGIPPAPAEDAAQTATDAARAVRPKYARAQDVSDPLFKSSDFFDCSDLVQVKYEMLRHVRVDGHTVAKAAASAGMSRPAFYAALALFERHGWIGLVPNKRGPKHAYKMSPEVMALVDEVVALEPEIATPELQRRIAAQFPINVHRRTVERARNRKKNEA